MMGLFRWVAVVVAAKWECFWGNFKFENPLGFGYFFERPWCLDMSDKVSRH